MTYGSILLQLHLMDQVGNLRVIPALWKWPSSYQGGEENARCMSRKCLLWYLSYYSRAGEQSVRNRGLGLSLTFLEG